MNSIPELLSAFEQSLTELDAKEKQLAATAADLKARQYDADAKLGDPTLSFDVRVQDGVAISILQADAKRQGAERDALLTQITRAASEIRNNLRGEIGTRSHA